MAEPDRDRGGRRALRPGGLAGRDRQGHRELARQPLNPPWIHVERLPEPGETIALDPEEARHAGRARRLRQGDAVVLADGAGTTGRAELDLTDRRTMLVRVLEHQVHERPAPAIHLASALPKGDRQSTLLAMTTQLGIASFTPLACERSVVLPHADPPERWQRILRENVKQSHQAWLPALRAPSTPADIVATAGGDFAWLLEPDADASLASSAGRDDHATGSHLLLIGPEGGFTEAETRSMTQAGARPTRLGSSILRIETAAVAAVATLLGATS